MSLASRGTRAVARPLRQQAIRQPRRSASGHSHDDHGAHGSGESAHHVAGGSGNESFGKGFYISLLSVPVAYLAYSLSTSNDNFINKQFLNYRHQLEKAEAQDVLHSAALEQAISDRSALLKEPRGVTRDLVYPEMFNHGSPWNVVAGEGSADLSKLRAHYEEQRKEMDAAREARMSKRS